MIEGFVDRIENGRLKGWAFDSSNPTRRVSLKLWHHGRPVLDLVASELREDLRDCGKGDGCCAFDVSLPKSIMDLDESEISVQVVSSGQFLQKLRPLIDIRKQLSRISIQGEGIEIGALFSPLWVAAGVSVHYVDRMTADELVKHYPKCSKDGIATPEIIDDGETLSKIRDASLNFVIANHMLEHCENPLGTIRVHLSKLHSGGVLYYIVPDMRFYVDASRTPTSFDHCVSDDTNGPRNSRMTHYREWVRSWNPTMDESSCEAEAVSLSESNYSIHFHVWNLTSFIEFLLRARAYLDGGFNIETVQFNYTEVIAVLRKQ